MTRTIIFGALLIASCFAAPVSAIERAGLPTQIPYKSEPAVSGGDAFRAVLVLVLVLGVAYAGIVAMKRYAGSRLIGDDKSQIRVLETRRISPKATLFAVDFDGKKLLIGQCGDRLTTIASHDRERI